MLYDRRAKTQERACFCRVHKDMNFELTHLTCLYKLYDLHYPHYPNENLSDSRP